MFGGYTLEQWLLFLYFYSFCGWIFESTYVSLHEHKFVNRGFLNGPFIPIYGSGAVMMLFASAPFKENIILTFIAGMIGATILELVVGLSLEAIFKVKYWDYSFRKIQYKGYISLVSSLTWGVFTVILNRYLHPAVLYALSFIPHSVISVGLPLCSVILICDIVISTRDALDLRDALVKLDELRREAVLLKRRLDVYRAFLDEDFKEFAKHHKAVEHAEEILHNLGTQIEQVRELIIAADESIKEKYEAERQELHVMVERFEGLKKAGLVMHKDKKERIKNRILNNPSMASNHYEEAFEIMKKHANEDAGKH